MTRKEKKEEKKDRHESCPLFPFFGGEGRRGGGGRHDELFRFENEGALGARCCVCAERERFRLARVKARATRREGKVERSSVVRNEAALFFDRRRVESGGEGAPRLLYSLSLLLSPRCRSGGGSKRFLSLSHTHTHTSLELLAAADLPSAVSWCSRREPLAPLP